MTLTEFYALLAANYNELQSFKSGCVPYMKRKGLSPQQQNLVQSCDCVAINKVLYAEQQGPIYMGVLTTTTVQPPGHRRKRKKKRRRRDRR